MVYLTKYFTQENGDSADTGEKLTGICAVFFYK